MTRKPSRPAPEGAPHDTPPEPAPQQVADAPEAEMAPLEPAGAIWWRDARGRVFQGPESPAPENCTPATPLDRAIAGI